jgi:hypothetical protein
MGHNNNEVKKGKIYKIIALTYNYDVNDVYFGSTTQKLSKRLSTHKSDYRTRKKRVVSTKILFDKYGIDNCKIVLVEEFDYISKEHIFKKEAEYILNNKCINKLLPYRSEEETKENRKKYFDNRKEIKKEYDKNYRDLKKDIIFEDNICECGGLYKTKHKSTHIKTKKHTDYIKTK